MTIAPWMTGHLRHVGLMVLTLFAYQGVAGDLGRRLAFGEREQLAIDGRGPRS